jgi:hypothetical protein
MTIVMAKSHQNLVPIFCEKRLSLEWRSLQSVGPTKCQNRIWHRVLWVIPMRAWAEMTTIERIFMFSSSPRVIPKGQLRTGPYGNT